MDQLHEVELDAMRTFFGFKGNSTLAFTGDVEYAFEPKGIGAPLSGSDRYIEERLRGKNYG